MNEREKAALRKVLEYLKDEERDFESQGKPEDHIYVEIMVLEKFVERVDELY